MTSRQKRKIARAAATQTAGTKSPATYQNPHHSGLTSQTLVLQTECSRKFADLLQSYIEKFQPRDGVEMSLIEEMVAARWRQQRTWGIQTAAMDQEMDNQFNDNKTAFPENTTEAGRTALAFKEMANRDQSLQLLLRSEAAYSRMHDRAMKALLRLREVEELPNDPNPPATPVPATESEKLRNDPEPAEASPVCPEEIPANLPGPNPRHRCAAAIERVSRTVSYPESFTS